MAAELFAAEAFDGAALGAAGGGLFGLLLMDGGGDFGEVGSRGVVALIGGIVDGGVNFGDDLVGNFGAAAAEDGGKG